MAENADNILDNNIEEKEKKLAERLARIEALEQEVKAKERRQRKRKNLRSKFFFALHRLCGRIWQDGRRKTTVLSTAR